jgi:3-dehydroquinate synthase
MARTIPVDIPGAEYTVHLGSGLLPKVGRQLRKLAPASARAFIVTAPEIWSLWGKTLLSGFPADNPPQVLFLPSGEKNKRFANVEALATTLSESGADRSSILIAFGGGIIGDVTGFLAAIYMRGIPYIQIPTTLLSQVDSSVGGKTGVNLSSGKNLIGSFHHPRAVFADTDVLHTLPPRELRAGLQECIKAGIIRAPALFNYMERNAHTILAADDAALTRVIASAIRMKAEVVTLDEREGGLRMILNYGHTIGHAIETVTNYRALLHGEAVAWGMLAATELSRTRGLLTAAQASRIHSVIQAYGPLPRFRATADNLVEATARDKKNRAGARRFILAESIGKAVIVPDVTDAELRSTIDWLLARVREAGQ